MEAKFMDSNAVLAQLPALIKAKRREEGLGLRAAAQESGVSPSTLSRLERGISSTLPDSDTLTKLVLWLNISLDKLLIENKSRSDSEAPQLSTPEVVEVQLRADKNLSPDTARALAEMFKLLYNQFSKNDNYLGTD
jgi:transcriptional regulator with XRE-family HTH domain